MESSLRRITSESVAEKIILCRVDLNVPMQNGRVTDNTRITRLIPTLQYLLQMRAKVVVISHFGRPDGKFSREFSLAPLADSLSQALAGLPVKFALDCIGPAAKAAVSELQPGQLLLLENLRFHAEEEKNDPVFAKNLAALGDMFVNDAFACSHRTHASISGITNYLPSFAGLLMSEEISALERVLGGAEKPVAAVVGGSKISTKLDLLTHLMPRMDALVIGGAMANSFLKAQGLEIGTSLYEAGMLETAKNLLASAEKNNCKIILPEDVVIASSLQAGAETHVVPVSAVPADKMILDIGPHSLANILTLLPNIKTVVWNGPLGAFEHRPFDSGSVTLARMLAYYTRIGSLCSVAGGGDVVAAVTAAGVAQEFSYISTAGGAFLEWLEGKTLPGVAPLYDAA
jgi:phosphoglycerate kinase